MSFNKVILLGNLTRDPETKATPSGQSVTSFAVAVNDTWTDKNGEKQERANFIDCDAWGQRGETIAKYFTKGRQILVEGSLRMDSWDDKDSGKKRSKLSVTVQSFSFVSDGKGSGTGATGGAKPAAKKDDAADDPIDLDDIPF
jgi:single-strand DNA-binding protein